MNRSAGQTNLVNLEEFRNTMIPGKKTLIPEIFTMLPTRQLSIKAIMRLEVNKALYINRIWGLIQLWLQMNGHAWFHLHGIHLAVWNRLGLKNSKWKYNTWQFNCAKTIFAFSCPPKLRRRAKLFVSCCRPYLVHQYTISPFPNLHLPGEIFTCEGVKS